MKIRDFNTLEYMSWVISSSSPHNGIVALRLDKGIDFLRLKESISVAVHNQPMLGVTIKSDSSGFYKSKFSPNIRQISHGIVLKDLFDEQLSLAFKYGESLLRFIYIKDSNYFICVFHHIIGDGASCIYFLKEVLKIYYKEICEEKLEKNFPDFLNIFPKVNLNTNFFPRTASNVKTKTDYFILKGDCFSKVMKSLKSRKETINSQIIHWLFKAASDAFNVNSYSMSSPVNLRKIYKIKANDRLSFLTSFISYELDKTSSISQVSKRIREEFLRRKPIRNMHYLNENFSHLTCSSNFSRYFSSDKPTLSISRNEVSFNNSSNSISEILVFVNSQEFFSTPESFAIQYGLTENSLSICISYPFPLVQHGKIKDFLEILKNSA